MKYAVMNPETPSRLRNQINKTNYLSVKHFVKGLDFDGRVKSGAYGVYFKKGGLGIKVLRTGNSLYSGSVGGRKNPQRVFVSPEWIDAIAEYTLLRIAQKSGHTPIPYCVKIVRVGQKYYPAIFMEHIRGISFANLYYDNDVPSREEERAHQGLEELERILKIKCGIDHMLDTGGDNAIITKYRGRVVQEAKLIDFSVDMVRMDGRKLKKALKEIPELHKYCHSILKETNQKLVYSS